jgi:carboxypeptidase Taq
VAAGGYDTRPRAITIAPPATTDEEKRRMTSIADALDELRVIDAELLDLGRSAGLLGWDQETMMPSSGVAMRARQQATLSGLAHERLTRSRVGDLLDTLAEPARQGTLSPADAALVRLVRRDYDHAIKLPNDLVRELARTTAEAVETWRHARAASRFADFAPTLEHIIALKRREADYLGYAEHPYDALLDHYEPGMTVRQLTPLLAGLRAATVALLGRIMAAPQVDNAILHREYDLDRQWAFGRWLLGAIGFDLERGRVDRSTHPFASGFGPGDVRLTTRMSATELNMGIFGNLHEGGHGLYEQGLDPELAGSSVGTYISLGVHESQSRLWENCVGRGLPFWRFAYPRLRATFPEHLADVPVERFVAAINRVEPSLIRVEADEVTYNLHIILRYDLERQLIDGSLPVADLPGAWNDLTRESFGIAPPDDREGVLQDTHWALGYLGYFPTYTLGNLYGAQLWAAARRDLPDLDERLAGGDTGTLLGWLRARIHAQGSIYQPADLIERATGEPPRPDHLIAYLNDRFGRLYGLG